MIATDSPNTVHYRTISCPCIPCISGEVQNCQHHPFVPRWQSVLLQFEPIQEGIPHQRHLRDIRNKLVRVAMQQDTLPWFCCLGRIDRLQQPAVLLMTANNLNLTDTTVRCNVLKPWNAPLNAFSWTVVERPTEVCHRARCHCNQLHWKEFALSSILEVAVRKGRGNLFKNLVCKFTPDSPHSVDLYHLSKTRESCESFERYSEKRLKYFNDFFFSWCYTGLVVKLSGGEKGSRCYVFARCYLYRVPGLKNVTQIGNGFVLFGFLG